MTVEICSVVMITTYFSLQVNSARRCARIHTQRYIFLPLLSFSCFYKLNGYVGMTGKYINLTKWNLSVSKYEINIYAENF